MAEIDPVQLAAALQQLHDQREQELRQRFDRSLPFADGLFDRWERARRLGFGADASIYDSALVFGEVSVGESTWIGPNVLLDGSGGRLVIGHHCSISTGVHIYTHDTVLWSLSMGVAPRHTAPVRIGSGCHVGAQSVVAAGTVIGDQCVIGANSFVKGELSDRTIAAGSPAVPIGMVRGDGAEVSLWVGPDAVEALRAT